MAESFLPTNMNTESIAPMPVMWRRVFRVVMCMSKEQYRSDMLYHVALSVAKSMREKGIITAEEYAEMDTMLIQKYNPYLGKLLSENA